MRLILILVIKIPFLPCQGLCQSFIIISFTPKAHRQRWALLSPLCGLQNKGLGSWTDLFPYIQLAITELDMKSKAMWLPDPPAPPTPHQTLLSLLFQYPRPIKPFPMVFHVGFICTWCTPPLALHTSEVIWADHSHPMWVFTSLLVPVMLYDY